MVLTDEGRGWWTPAQHCPLIMMRTTRQAWGVGRAATPRPDASRAVFGGSMQPPEGHISGARVAKRLLHWIGCTDWLHNRQPGFAGLRRSRGMTQPPAAKSFQWIFDGDVLIDIGRDALSATPLVQFQAW